MSQIAEEPGTPLGKKGAGACSPAEPRSTPLTTPEPSTCDQSSGRNRPVLRRPDSRLAGLATGSSKATPDPKILGRVRGVASHRVRSWAGGCGRLDSEAYRVRSGRPFLAMLLASLATTAIQVALAVRT